MDSITIKNVIKDLETAIGKRKVVYDADIIEKYSKDETSDLYHYPDIVVRAGATEDVSKTLSICSKYIVPVVARGAGTGVTGGAVPVQGGVVLSLELMNRIIEIDRENMVAVVEPGVITGDLQRAVQKEGMMYPPDPASLDSCSIAGNVAEGAGGPRAVKYGTTKDYIIGLEFVLPNGSIINYGGKIVKNATGYNLSGVLVGSEGTLAVITKIFLRLIPLPSHSLDFLIPFKNIDDAVKNVNKIICSRIIPSTIEFMEEDSIKLVSEFLGGEMPFPDAGAHLLIQVDGNSEEDLLKDLESITACVDTDYEIIVAQSRSQSDRIWKARRSMREAIQEKSPIFLAEDCVVPRSMIAVFLREVKDFLNTRNLSSVMFGHAGDGNVHIDVLKKDIDYVEWKKMLPELKENIYKIAIKHGGTISGEHGIGYIRKDFLSLAVSRDEIDLLRRIKHAFDPDMILNPGKIF
ncbi:MAG: FAD-binding oxidoreductase [Spirochaetota bacterium]|nr:FAD-binding oxidoreductase [Spirochaetota bacterium]